MTTSPTRPTTMSYSPPPLLTVSGIFALITGCAVGPAYHRPQVDAPEKFIAQDAIAARTQTRFPADATRWWEAFDDPMLTHFVQLGLSQNLELAEAQARVIHSRALLESSNAALLPSGEVTASATRTQYSKQTPIGELITPYGFVLDNVFEADLGASWELDLFGGRRRARESASALYVAARVDVDAAKLAIAAQVTDTYITVRGLQMRIEIANQQIEKQRQLVSTVRVQFSEGYASALQLKQAEGALAQVEAVPPELTQDLDASLNAVDVLLGAQPGTHRSEMLKPLPIPKVPAISAAMGPPDLIRRRPDLVVAERRLAASNAKIGEALSEYFPKFSLSGLLGTASTSTGSLFIPGAREWQGVVGLRWRLFDFARIDAEVSGARGRKAEALAAYKLAVLRATEDVENAFSALLNSERQELTLAKGEDSLSEARDLSLTAYKGGVVSLIEVLDADSRLLSTRDARARAQIQAARAAVASFRALGGGWGDTPHR